MLCWVLLTACARVPDEQRIRADIATMQHAIENHDLHGFMDHISGDFTGNDGTADREGLANVLRLEVLRNDEVGVALGPIDVELQDSRATVNLTATFTGGPGSLIPDHAAIYTIRSGWKKEGSQWRCFNATWEQKL
jgi:ketosteroid isomerase-like protein